MRSIRLITLTTSTVGGGDGPGSFTPFTGTQVFYDKFIERIHDAQINLDTATLKVALTSDSIGSPPGGGATATDPRFGSGGAQNLSTNQVSGPGYTAGGETISGGSGWIVGTGNRMEYQALDANWTYTASGASGITYGVVYVDDANKYAISYLELDNAGSPISIGDTNINIEWAGGVLFHAQGTQVP